MPTALELAIFRTLAYFAYFQYPLSAFEVWKWLLAPEAPATLYDVMTALRASPWLGERVASAQGFYGVGDVPAQVVERHARLLDALRKYAKLRTALQYLARLPYVEGIAVCNSLALQHTRRDSDIDLLIVTAAERVWTVRFFAIAGMALARQRPGEARHDPLCCSFFVDRHLLNFAGLRLDDDPYFAYWTASLVPMLDRGVFTKLWEENAWLADVLPHARPVRRARAYRFRTQRRVPTAVLGEAPLRRFQEARLPEPVAALKNRDSRVVVNNHMLKFHANDRREAIAAALREKMTHL